MDCQSFLSWPVSTMVANPLGVIESCGSGKVVGWFLLSCGTLCLIGFVFQGLLGAALLLLLFPFASHGWCEIKITASHSHFLLRLHDFSWILHLEPLCSQHEAYAEPIHIISMSNLSLSNGRRTFCTLFIALHLIGS